MKIRYNIAKKKKVNYLRFILISSILSVLSLGFILVGVKTLSTTAKQFQNKKNELKICLEEKQTKAGKNKQQENEIEEIKKRWQRRRQFANNLVNNKTFPFLEKLNKLEELLPAGVFIKDITLSTKGGAAIQFNLAAHSSAKLLEAYNAFIKYNLEIPKEVLKDGLYNATMKIKLGNKK